MRLLATLGLLLVSLTLGIASAEPAAAQERFLGCYADKSERDLASVTNLGRGNDVRRCIDHCTEQGFSYAGLQYGTFCTCGNTYGKYGRSDRCNMSCPANPRETCGGEFANSVYQTRVPREQARHLGCFADAERDRDLPDLTKLGQRNSPQVCIDHCSARGHAYAGLQFGTFCACGDRYGRHGRSDRCDDPCPGDPRQNCGGTFANSIYSTGVGGGGGSVGDWSRGATLRGSELHAFAMRRASPELCRSACEADRRCEGWTYARPGSFGRREAQCFLKERITASQRDDCCISGSFR